MPTINFYLDREDAAGNCPVFMVFQAKGKKFKFFTKEKVPSKYWDKKKQRVKQISEASEINDILNDMEERLKKLERQLRLANGSSSFEQVKDNFLNARGHNEKEFFAFFDQILGDLKSTHQHATLQKYNTVISDLKEFETYNKRPITFETIDFKFQSRFLEFLQTKKKNTQNTVAKKISTLKTILNMATKAKVNKNLDFQDFQIKNVETEKVYLTNDELFKVFQMDLSENPKLDKVRDLFCFGCFTGLRYSDVTSLKFEEINTKLNASGEEEKFIKIQVHKTRDPLTVPLNKFAISILNKYQHKLEDAFDSIKEDFKKHENGTKALPSISIQKMNDYVKDLTALAGIDTPTIVTKYIGTKRIDKKFPKYKLLATHTARRTFAILSLEKGMRIEVLQKILGHKSIRTTMKYVFILEDVKTVEMGKAWND